MKNRCSLLLVAVVAFVAMPFLARPLAAQATAEMIRGKVTGLDSLPIPNAAVTCLSIQGGITKIGKTDKNGRFSVAYPNGEGDYWCSFLAVGFQPRRFEVKRIADEAILIADTKMTPVALETVAVTANAPRQPPNRNGVATDITGTDRALAGGLIGADQAGNLAAMAAMIPGIQLIPGVDGNPDMFSALGLDPSQNNTTLNGVPSNLLGLSPDAGLGGTVRTSGGGDVSIGGFSGAQISLNVPSGTNYSSRRMSGIFNSPQLELTDAVGRSNSQTLLSLSGNGSGPISLDKAFYYGSYSIRRSFLDEQDLFSTGRGVLQNAGISSDSAQRLNQALQGLGIPRSGSSVPGTKNTDLANLLLSIDFAPKAQTSGASYKITATGGYTGASPASNSMTATPSYLSTNKNLNGSLQARHTTYIGSGMFAGTLSQTSLAATMSTNESDPYLRMPGGSVRVVSDLDDGSSTAKFLSFGGNSATKSSTKSELFFFQNQLQWVAPNNKHTLKLVTELRDELSKREIPASLGTFSYQSIADLEAGIPSSYSRSLTPRDDGASAITGALGINDSWIPKPGIFQMQYGVRLDGNRFYNGPDENPAVEQAFGVKNNYVPNKIYVSPRFGFTWTYGKGTQIPLQDFFVTGPRARVYGGLSMNQNLAGAQLVSGARSFTGLPGSALTLSCIGTATPIPDWDAYRLDPNSAPTQCADGTGGTVFASTLPSVQMFDSKYKQSKSVNANLSWSGAIFDNRFNATFGGTYSFQLDQPGTIDLNFSPVEQFSLANEGGRPVYARTSSIVPATGLIASRDARVSQDFGRVTLNQSNLRGEARQLSVNISPLNYLPTNFFWSVGYAYLNRIDRFNGFSSTVGNPLDLSWGSSPGPRHSINYNLSYNIKGAVVVRYAGSLQSGQRYSPMIDRDVNGDGSFNDRAFVFDPSSAGADSAVKAGMQSLLANGSPSARDCLRGQMDKLAKRNSCTSPWALMQQTVSISLTPGHVWLPPRTSVYLTVSNPLAAADLLVHGDNKLHGWGQRLTPDQQLLYVRGFDPVTQQYKYEVNQRFGSTSLSQTTVRSPAIVTLNIGYDLAPPRDWQSFRLNTLDRGRAGRPGTKIPESSLRSYSTAIVVNPMARILQTADALKLSRKQADSIAKLSRGYTLFLDSLWNPIAKYMGALGDHYDVDIAQTKYVEARSAAIDYLIKVAPLAKGLLTKGQRRAMNASVAQYLEPRYLEYLRTGALGGGMEFIR